MNGNYLARRDNGSSDEKNGLRPRKFKQRNVYFRHFEITALKRFEGLCVNLETGEGNIRGKLGNPRYKPQEIKVTGYMVASKRECGCHLAKELGPLSGCCHQRTPTARGRFRERSTLWRLLILE